jgi:hypothetical protein
MNFDCKILNNNFPKKNRNCEVNSRKLSDYKGVTIINISS